MERTISISMGKGSLAHNNRKFVAENVDRSRVPDNVIYRQEDLKAVYHKLFDNALQEYNSRQKRKDRKIVDYYEKIRQSRQEKLFYEMIVQIGNRDDMGVKDSEMAGLAKEILSEYMEEFQTRNPNLYVFNAVLHMDEATPHLHIDFVPYITDSRRGLTVRNTLKGALAAQGFVGEGKRCSEWSRWTDSEKEALAGVMERYEIRWKQLGTKEEHLSVYDFKKKKRKEEVQILEHEIGQKAAELSDTVAKKEQVQKEVDSLGEIKKSQADTIADNRETIQKLDTMISEKDDELYDIRQDIADSGRQAEERRELLQELNDRIEESNAIISQNSRQIAEQRTETEEVSKELQSVEQDLSVKKILRDSVQSDYQFYQKMVGSKQNEIDDLNMQKEGLDGEIGKLCDKKEQVRKELETAEGTLSEINDRIEKAQDKADILQVQMMEMQMDIDEQKKMLRDHQEEVARAKDTNRQMDGLERQLSGAEWSLPEPSRFMSVREFFQKIALPLVNKLKDMIRSLYREVLDLRSRLRGQEDFQQYKAKTTEYVMKLSTENEQLKETKEAYENIRSAIGREECERLEKIGRYQRLGLLAAGDERMTGWKQIR